MNDVVALVRASQGGDLAAYEALVRRFQDMAYGYARSRLGDAHLAEDATQEALLHAYRRLGDLRQPAAFPGWLRRIVRTQCDRIGRVRTPKAMGLNPGDRTADSGVGPSGRAQADELAEKSPALVGELRMIHMCSQSDGACAVVMASEDVVKALGSKAAWVRDISRFTGRRLSPCGDRRRR